MSEKSPEWADSVRNNSVAAQRVILAEIADAMDAAERCGSATSFRASALIVAKRRGLSLDTMYRWKRRHEFHHVPDRPVAPLPREARRAPGRQRKRVTAAAIAAGVELYYQPERPSLACVVRRVRLLAPRKRWRLFSDKTFARRLREASTPELIARRNSRQSVEPAIPRAAM